MLDDGLTHRLSTGTYAERKSCAISLIVSLVTIIFAASVAI